MLRKKKFVIIALLLIITNIGFSQKKLPNIVFVLCDDLGYGDLGCYGNKLNRTPEIDKLAQRGVRFTDFYAASGLCTPSRAAFMTGCYPIRIGMEMNFRGECVCFPVDEMGLNPKEITIAELLKQKNYKTALIGKWHLGDQKEFLPTKQGFDYYYGVPYSNDTPPDFNWEMHHRIYRMPEIPLVRNESVIEAPFVQETITERYTNETIKFIKQNKDNPFFVELAHTMPHSPLNPGARFKGKSKNGLLGDAVEEIDWSLGKIITVLRDLNILENTIVVFTSDNGAPGNPPERSNKPLSGLKGTCMEGGMRVPMIISWPGKIPAGKECRSLATMMDFYKTFGNLAGATIPTDRIIDGFDISQLIFNPENAKSPYPYFAYYVLDQLQAIRVDNWKLHLPLENKKSFSSPKTPPAELRLFNLKNDISEQNNIASSNTEVVERLKIFAKIAENWIGNEKYLTPNSRPAGYVPNPVPLEK